MKIKIFNLNIMHGRNTRNPVFPFYFSQQRITENLDKICEIIKRKNPDVITLQEVDKPTRFNGGLDQIKEISSRIGYEYSFLGIHEDVRIGKTQIMKFGTAIISKYPLINKKSFKFPPTFLTPKKGFVMATIIFPGSKEINVVSLHTSAFDIFKSEHRKKQIGFLEKYILNGKPLIIAGDINSDYMGKEDTLRYLVESLSLKIYKPRKKMYTHSSSYLKKRIDWILTTKEFEFIKYQTIKTKVSDHFSVYTELELN